ncbi:MAG: hypothetical protein QG635_2367, partial [Bacteroidota bacterium]|nr:hypothetical protein [Bacteroidota bacterium]
PPAEIEEIYREIARAIKSVKQGRILNPENIANYLTGSVLQNLRGRVQASSVYNLIKEIKF